MLIGVCCDRGSPGSTSVALALGVVGGEPTVVVEADPFGGDLALRCRARTGGVLPETPTVLTAAVAARTSTSPDLVVTHAHEFTESVRVVPGHLSAEQSTWVTDWTPLARVLSASSTRVVADLGRIHSASPTLPVAAAADVVVVVARPDLGSIVHLRERLERLVPRLAGERGRPPVVVPVLVTGRRGADLVVAEVRHLLTQCAVAPAIADVGWVAWDPAGLTRLEHGQVAGRDARSALLRSTAAVDQQIRAVTPAAPAVASSQVVGR